MRKSTIMRDLVKIKNSLDNLMSDIDSLQTDVEELMEVLNEDDPTDDDSDGYY